MKHAIRKAGIGFLLGTTVALAALPASAQGRAMGPGGPGGHGGLFAAEFTDLDVNGDGQITEDDLVAEAHTMFDPVDTDGSGTLDASEIAAQIEAQMAERFAGRQTPRNFDPAAIATKMAERAITARDTDDDGALSLEEMGPPEGFGRIIDRFDTDDDNAISKAEFDEAKAEMTEHHGGRGGFGRQGGMMGPRGGFGRQGGMMGPRGGFGRQGGMMGPRGGFGRQGGFGRHGGMGPQGGFFGPQGGFFGPQGGTGQ